MFTLVASTDERRPLYLYYDLDSKQYCFSRQLGVSVTWVSDGWAQEFIGREDTKVVAHRCDHLKE